MIPPIVKTKVLKFGDEHEMVVELSRDLSKLGLLDADHVTRFFDRDVKGAVLAFQASAADFTGAPLMIDGIVGPLTWGAIKAKLGKPLPREVNDRRLDGADAVAVEALAEAFSLMRQQAGEVGGNNKGPWVKKFLHGFAPEGSPWCAGFVSYCYEMAAQRLNVPMPFTYSVSAMTIWNDCRARGFAKEGLEPTYADLVFWRRGSEPWQGHVGIVAEIREGQIVTIEGNRTPLVRTFVHPLSRVEKYVGFARIRVNPR